MPATQLIINPIAGQGQAQRQRRKIFAALQRHHIDFDVSETTRAGEGARLATVALDAGYRMLIVVGGDGLLHEVVNGLMAAGARPEDVALAVIPVGSGNDFAKMLHLPAHDIETACQRIQRGHSRLVDVGQINALATPQHPVFPTASGQPGYFINMLGIGFTALVANEAAQFPWLTGTLLYLAAAIRTLVVAYRTPLVTLHLDGSPVRQPMTEVAVANGRCEGGGFWMAPTAAIDDGKFDITFARRLSRAGILRLIPHIMKGTHIYQPSVTTAQAQHVSIQTEEPLPVQADGEILCTAAISMDLTVLPQSLRFIC